MGTAIIVIALAVIVGLIVFFQVRKHRRAKASGGCGGACDCCKLK